MCYSRYFDVLFCASHNPFPKHTLIFHTSSIPKPQFQIAVLQQENIKLSRELDKAKKGGSQSGNSAKSGEWALNIGSNLAGAGAGEESIEVLRGQLAAANEMIVAQSGQLDELRSQLREMDE